MLSETALSCIGRISSISEPSGADVGRSGDQQGTPQESQDELMNLMTIMYVVIQETLTSEEEMSSTCEQLCKWDTSLRDDAR
jgi:hypothetical protein